MTVLSKLAMAISFLLLITTTHAQIPQKNISIPSSGLPLLQHATFVKPLKPDTLIQFTIWLKLRNKSQLDQLARDLYDPNSAHYQKFLTTDQFIKQYAPKQSVEQAVLNYVTSQGMQAKIVNHSVRVTSTVQQIEHVFNVRMNTYLYQNRTVYSNDAAPKLPSDIAKYVSEITGLSNMVRARPGSRARPHNQIQLIKPHDLNLAWDTFIPFAQPTTTSLNGFTGAQLQTTYNFANIPPVVGTTINGSGQTLVIIDACGTHTAQKIKDDANLYNAANNITLFSDSNFTVINPDGTPFTSCAHPNAGWNGEIALDIESSHTLAPAANTVLVLASSDTGPLDTAVSDVINTLINNNYTIAGFHNAYVVSNSWGLSETEGGSSPSMETTLETAAVHGISFNFSTGDCGDGTYNSSWPCSAFGSVNVEYPASSLYTTAVGATSAFVDNQWNYAFETLWGSYYQDGFYGGTTGGISQYYGPAAWQSSISTFSAGGYTLGTIGTYNKRALPDISMVGDPYTGLTIYEGSSSYVYGGTSMACPLFSATLLLINQSRALLNGGTANPIGQAAPYLYTQNSALSHGEGLRLISPPHLIINGATPPPPGAPLSAFTIYINGYNYDLTFGWDSSMTLAPENQFWNDGVGVGSPYLPNFVSLMASL